jgi:adenine-specific DNA-methyltransferase
MFMATMLTPPEGSTEVTVLDPGAGTGILGVSAARALLAAGAGAIHVVAVEADPSVLPLLERALTLARLQLGEGFRFTIHAGDFLGLQQPRIGQSLLPTADVVVANPPYFKMSPTEAHGGNAPNAYARFMEVAGSMLRPGGQLVFIVPRSFASGFYFQQFRRRFHDQFVLERAHVFASRRDAFQDDDVLQENIIVAYRRAGTSAGPVTISSSKGVGDLESAVSFVAGRKEVLRPRDPYGVVYLPTGADDASTMQTVFTWQGSLRGLGLEVSTGPVVPFRSTENLTREEGADTVPLLWMQHVRQGAVRWPLGTFRKPEHIRAGAGDKLLVPNRTCILLRRFSAKEEPRRLTVAVLRAGRLPGKSIGLENHLNYVYRPRGVLDDELALGLAALLGSTLIDDFFRIQSGNTQVSATELRALPLPPEPILRDLGRAVDTAGDEVLARQDDVDALVADLVEPHQRARPTAPVAQDGVVAG